MLYRPVTKVKFIACYPFLPYQLIPIPDVLHGLRVAGGRGSSDRRPPVLLGITAERAQQQGYAWADVGRLVALDEVYAEIEDAEIPSEVRRGWVALPSASRSSVPERILRALYLLRRCSMLRALFDNLSRLLTSRVDTDFSVVRSQVETGLQQSGIAARYVAKTGDQYEYLSGERKRIEEEIAEEDIRTAHKRDRLGEFLTAANLEVGLVRYEDAYRFDVRVVCDDQVVVSKGGIEVRMISPLKALLDGLRVEDLEAESLATPTPSTGWRVRRARSSGSLIVLSVWNEVVKRYEADSTKSTEMEGIVRERGGDSMSASARPCQRTQEWLSAGPVHLPWQCPRCRPAHRPAGRLFSAEVSAIIPKVYTHFQKAKHVVAR